MKQFVNNTLFIIDDCSLDSVDYFSTNAELALSTGLSASCSNEFSSNDPDVLPSVSLCCLEIERLVNESIDHIMKAIPVRFSLTCKHNIQFRYQNLR